MLNVVLGPVGVTGAASEKGHRRASGEPTRAPGYERDVGPALHVLVSPLNGTLLEGTITGIRRCKSQDRGMDGTATSSVTGPGSTVRAYPSFRPGWCDVVSTIREKSPISCSGGTRDTLAKLKRPYGWRVILKRVVLADQTTMSS
jgi:hypothetical protein